MIPAADELAVCSASANSRYEAAFANKAATAIVAHSRGDRGTLSRRTSMTAKLGVVTVADIKPGTVRKWRK